jgi:hypothetical protein
MLYLWRSRQAQREEAAIPSITKAYREAGLKRLLRSGENMKGVQRPPHKVKNGRRMALPL